MRAGGSRAGTGEKGNLSALLSLLAPLLARSESSVLLAVSRNKANVRIASRLVGVSQARAHTSLMALGYRVEFEPPHHSFMKERLKNAINHLLK